MAQADSIIPHGIQGLDRYGYSNNNPIKYTDPSGHTPACDNDDWDGCHHDTSTTSTVPSGLTTGGQQAYTELQNLGLLGNTQAAMVYVVGTEFNSGLVNQNVMTEHTQANYLFQAMTNLYRTYCSNGAWSAQCLNNFWGYNQGPLTGSAMPTNYSPAQFNQINDMASAILNPDQSFNTSGVANITASSVWNGGCTPGSGSANLCHYATKAPGISNWLTTTPGVSVYGQPNSPGQSWSYDHGTPEKLYAWWNGTDTSGNPEIFDVMTQAMYDYLRVNYPSTIYGN